MDDCFSMPRLSPGVAVFLGLRPERLDSFERKSQPKFKPISPRRKSREEEDSTPLRQIVYPMICQFCRASRFVPYSRPAVQEQSIAKCSSSITPVRFVVVHEVPLI